MHYHLLEEANKAPEPSCDTARNREAGLYTHTHTHLKTCNSKAEADRNHLIASELIQISAWKNKELHKASEVHSLMVFLLMLAEKRISKGEEENWHKGISFLLRYRAGSAPAATESILGQLSLQLCVPSPLT